MQTDSIKSSHEAVSMSFTSGKGGVGKSTLTANLGFKLASQGNRVLILDGDLGMANIDIMFGVRAHGSLSDVLKGHVKIHDVLVPLAGGLDLVSGGSGVYEMQNLNAFERRSILDSVRELKFKYDYLLIDTAPGISPNVLQLNAAAESTIVIITPEPASVADSYALIKTLHHLHRIHRFSVICNEVTDESAGLQLFDRFSRVVDQFLNVGLDYLGCIPEDSQLRAATNQQRLIVRQSPSADSALALSGLSVKISAQLELERGRGGRSSFWDNLVGVA